RARGGLADGATIRAHTILDPRPGAGPFDYAYSLQGDYLKKPARARLEMSGRVSPDLFSSRLSASAAGVIPKVDQAWIKDCELKLTRQSSELRPGALNLNCPVQFKVPVPPEGFPPLAMPAR